MKRKLKGLLTNQLVARSAFFLRRGVAPIFMAHRFCDVKGEAVGHDPVALRANLSWLRANNFRVVPLAQLLDRLTEGAPVERMLAFTIDDGYADFARVAAPIFAEFECPVTVFLTTGFIDGHHWMWWDRVKFACSALRRETEAGAMIESLKSLTESERMERISSLLRDAGLELPATPSHKYAPLSWDDVRRLARSGVTFGPHSVTHPMLARTSPEQSRFEIAESWRRVREEVGDAALPVFCYPNGEEDDFGIREQDIIAAEGMRGALRTRGGFTSHRDFAGDHPTARFRLPRFGYSDDRLEFIQVVSGIERIAAAFSLATQPFRRRD